MNRIVALALGAWLTLCAAASSAWSAVVVTADIDQRHQTIEGFGTMWTYWAWPAPYDDPKFYDMLVDDLGITLLRVEIPGSLEPANDDADPNHYNWSGFNTREMDRLMRFCREFDKRGVKRYLGDTFSPAAFLKTNRALEWGGAIRADMWEEYAEFMSAFIILAQKNYGINITDITIQNELLFIEFYGSCVYHPEAAREAVRALMRKFKKEGITTRIHMPEDMMYYDRMMAYIAPTMADPETRNFPGAFATHRQGGFDEVRRWYNSTKQYGRQQWMTETSGHPQTWTGAMNMARDIYDYLVGGNYSVWVYLRPTNDGNGSESLMMNGKPAPKYYAAKQYYRYVRPGAVRVEAHSPDPNLLVSAFRHDVDGTLTFVLINRSDKQTTIQLSAKGDGLPTQYTLYRSTQTEGCVDKGQVDATQEFTMPAQSIITLYGKSAALETRPALDPLPIAWRDPNPTAQPQRWGNSNELITPGIVWAAGRAGNVDAIRRDLQNGVDVNTTDFQGWTALHNAILNGNQKNVIKLLLDSGADVNRPAKDGWTPLHMAAAGFHNDRYAAFQQIMAAKPSINVATLDGWTPLHAAAASAHVTWSQKEPDTLNRVRDLLKAGANLEAKDIHGRTPLHWAAMQGYQVQLTVRDGMTRLLLDAKADVAARDDSGRIPLHYAAEQGYNPIVQALLEAGAAPDAKDNQGDTPIQLAQRRALTLKVTLLQTHNSAAPRTSGKLGPELIQAARAGNTAEVKRLLAEGADVNSMDSDGFRAIDRARDFGHRAIVELLQAEARKQSAPSDAK